MLNCIRSLEQVINKIMNIFLKHQTSLFIWAQYHSMKNWINKQSPTNTVWTTEYYIMFTENHYNW